MNTQLRQVRHLGSLILALAASASVALAGTSGSTTGTHAPTSPGVLPTYCPTGGPCAPPVRSFGYHATQWRRWPGALPGEQQTQPTDEEAIPTPAIDLPSPESELDRPAATREPSEGEEAIPGSSRVNPENLTAPQLPGGSAIPTIPRGDQQPDLRNPANPLPPRRDPNERPFDDTPGLPGIDGFPMNAPRQNPAIQARVSPEDAKQIPAAYLNEPAAWTPGPGHPRTGGPARGAAQSNARSPNPLRGLRGVPRAEAKSQLGKSRMDRTVRQAASFEPISSSINPLRRGR